MSRSVVAVIPARGGSKGVPGKNLRPVGGVTLISRAVGSALASSAISAVYVSTDDSSIALEAESAGARVIDRPADISGDTATSESALLHALDTIEAAGAAVDVVVFIQATSPFIDPADLDDAISRVLDGESDVVFSAVETYGFLWQPTAEGARGVNHEWTVRPRRQDRDPHFLETGAFYVMRADGFRDAGFRFFGRVGIAVVDEAGAIEIDTAEHLLVADALAASSAPSASHSAAPLNPTERGHT